MKKSKLEPSHIKHEIAKRIASGESQRNIAKELGICHTTVSRFVNRDEVQAIIEDETLNLLQVLPDAVENIKSLVKGMKSLPIKDHKNRELSYKASQKVLESAGIMNTPTPSQTVVNIMNKDAPVISPIIDALIRKHFGGLIDIPATDKLNNFTKSETK